MGRGIVNVVQVHPLRIGDEVRRLDGQGGGTVTRTTRPGDTHARVWWGSDSESEIELSAIAVYVDEDDESGDDEGAAAKCARETCAHEARPGRHYCSWACWQLDEDEDADDTQSSGAEGSGT